MPINANQPQRWKTDIAASVDMYNRWFMKSAPAAFRASRQEATQAVVKALLDTNDLADFGAEALKRAPGVLPILRMATCPPLARDRLVGLAGVIRAW
ncbi:MAG TPA: XamI family restriction endonuclease [Pirellulales bacterium]|nr:XamI family restriction endonuclease [Pirellulales bacterium]